MQLPTVSGPQDPSQIQANENALIVALNQSVGLFAPQTASVGNTSDTTSDLLQTITIPPNFFTAPGQILQLRAAGTLAANTHARTITMSLIQGTTTVSMTGNGTLGTATWTADLNIMNTGNAGTPTQTYFGNIGVGPSGTTTGTQYANVNSSTTLSTTAAITVSVFGQTGTAAANDVVCDAFYGMILK